MRARLAARGMRGEVVDSYRYAASLFSKVVSDGYIGMVRTIPQVYGFIYDRAERATVAGGFRVWAGEFTARNIHGLIERLRPSAVVCTHAFPCGVMAAYKREFDPALPVMGIVTDFVVHPFWVYKNIDAYAVATPEIRAALIARGVDPAAIGVDGIPVDPRFGAAAGRPRRAARAAGAAARGRGRAGDGRRAGAGAGAEHGARAGPLAGRRDAGRDRRQEPRAAAPGQRGGAARRDRRAGARASSTTCTTGCTRPTSWSPNRAA